MLIESYYLLIKKLRNLLINWKDLILVLGNMIRKLDKLFIKIRILKELINRLKLRSRKDGKLSSGLKLRIMNKLFKISLARFNRDSVTSTKTATKKSCNYKANWRYCHNNTSV